MWLIMIWVIYLHYFVTFWFYGNICLCHMKIFWFSIFKSPPYCLSLVSMDLTSVWCGESFVLLVLQVWNVVLWGHYQKFLGTVPVLYFFVRFQLIRMCIKRKLSYVIYKPVENAHCWNHVPCENTCTFLAPLQAILDSSMPENIACVAQAWVCLSSPHYGSPITTPARHLPHCLSQHSSCHPP